MSLILLFYLPIGSMFGFILWTYKLSSSCLERMPYTIHHWKDDWQRNTNRYVKNYFQAIVLNLSGKRKGCYFKLRALKKIGEELFSIRNKEKISVTNEREGWEIFIIEYKTNQIKSRLRYLLATGLDSEEHSK